MNGSIRWLNAFERASREVNDGWTTGDIEGEVRRLAQVFEVVWARLEDADGKVWFVEPRGDKVVWFPLRHHKDSRPVKDGTW